MNPVEGRMRSDGWPGHGAIERLVAALRRGAFWTGIALAVLYVPLLGAWEGAVPLEVLVGLVGVHGAALLVGHGHHDPQGGSGRH